MDKVKNLRAVTGEKWVFKFEPFIPKIIFKDKDFYISLKTFFRICFQDEYRGFAFLILGFGVGFRWMLKPIIFNPEDQSEKVEGSEN